MQFVTCLYNNTAYYYTVLVGDTRVSKLVPIEHESKPTALYELPVQLLIFCHNASCPCGASICMLLTPAAICACCLAT